MNPSGEAIPPLPHQKHPERKILDSKASDKGFFSGRRARRMMLSANDPSFHFAVKLATKNEIKGEKGIDWVLLKDANNLDIQVQVSSLAKRTGLTKSQIKTFDENGTLENQVNEIIDRYNADYQLINSLNQEILNIYKAPYSVHNKFNDEKIRLLQVKNAFKNNFYTTASISALIKNKNLTKILENFSKLLNLGGPATEKDVQTQKEYIQEYFDNLVAIDPNFDPQVKITRQKLGKEGTSIWSTEKKNYVWENIEIVKARAYDPVQQERGKEAIRVKLFPGTDNKHAVKTDGYLYHQKPKATNTHIPYSQDGKTWLMLNIDSLRYRLNITGNDKKIIERNELSEASEEKLEVIIKDATRVIREKAPVKETNIKELYQTIQNSLYYLLLYLLKKY